MRTERDGGGKSSMLISID